MCMCFCTYLYCFVVILCYFDVLWLLCSCFVLLCIFIFVCTSVVLLPPGESPSSSSGSSSSKTGQDKNSTVAPEMLHCVNPLTCFTICTRDLAGRQGLVSSVKTTRRDVTEYGNIRQYLWWVAASSGDNVRVADYSEVQHSAG